MAGVGGYDNTERSENSKKSVLCGKKVTDIAKMEKTGKKFKNFIENIWIL